MDALMLPEKALPHAVIMLAVLADETSTNAKATVTMALNISKILPTAMIKPQC